MNICCSYNHTLFLGKVNHAFTFNTFNANWQPHPGVIEKHFLLGSQGSGNKDHFRSGIEIIPSQLLSTFASPVSPSENQ